MTSELWNLLNRRVKEEDLIVPTYKCSENHHYSGLIPWLRWLVAGLSILLLLDWVPGLVIYDSTFAHHCKFTSTPACHVNLGNYLSLRFFFSPTAGIQMLKFFGAIKVCPALTSFLNKPFCKIYNGTDEEYILHLILLCKGCFSPPITDKNHTVCNRGIVYCPAVYQVIGRLSKVWRFIPREKVLTLAVDKICIPGSIQVRCRLVCCALKS